MIDDKRIGLLLSEHLFHQTPRKPTHGSCCTCQNCGWDYDSCKCDVHESWDGLGMVVEAMEAKRFYLDVIEQPGDPVLARFTEESGLWEGHEGTANDWPRAVAIAALRALGVTVE